MSSDEEMSVHSLTLSDIENEKEEEESLPRKLGSLKQSNNNASMIRIASPFSASASGHKLPEHRGSITSIQSGYEDSESQGPGPQLLSKENSTVFRHSAGPKKRSKSIILSQLLQRRPMDEQLQESIKARRISSGLGLSNHAPRLADARQMSFASKNFKKAVDDVAASSRKLRRGGRGTQVDPRGSRKGGKLFEYLTLRMNRNNAKKKASKDPSIIETNKVHPLPRGGVHVMTSIGPVQFGMPPETIKDSLNMGLATPVIYIVPKERFNLTVGVNVAELEFPTFYNFFIKQTRITLVTHRKAKEDLQTIFRESLYGPEESYLYSEKEYEHCPPELRESRPDHALELKYFAEYKPTKTSKPVKLTLDKLMRYSFYDDKGYAMVSNDKGEEIMVYDNKEKFCFEVFDYNAYKKGLRKERNDVSKEAKGKLGGKVQSVVLGSSDNPYQAFAMARGPGYEHLIETISYDDAETVRVNWDDEGIDSEEESEEEEPEEPLPRKTPPPRKTTRIGTGRKTLMRKKEDDETFNIPNFGLTILGNSHGFDPDGTTTGFVVWINGKGVMVDPPPHSSKFLIDHGIQPKSITALILTHCHADHDAGTFQKMITEHKVELMTSATIFESFKRKYSAISNLTPEFIDRLVSFRPVFLEEPNYWNGAQFRFFYSLHSIPTVGFEVSLDGQSIVYSADTMYSPKEFKRMHKDGVISSGRMESLTNFPWHCDVVLHESGVPPIHTTIESLLELPEEKRKNIHLVHIDGKSAEAARKKKLKIAKAGMKNSIILRKADRHYTTTKLLQVISSMEIFEHISVSKALELVLMAKPRKYGEDEVLVEEGAQHEKFIIIVSGTATVKFGDLERSLYEGDYFGELMFVEDKDIDKKAYMVEAVTAATPLYTLELDKYALKNLMLNDNEMQMKMEILIRARIAGCWEAIESNEMLSSLSVSQKTVLQSLLDECKFKRGEVICIEETTEKESTKKGKVWKWQKGEDAAFAVLVLKGELAFDELHGKEEGQAEIQNLPKLGTGMLIYDYRASVSKGNKLKTTLRVASEEATVFTIRRETFGRFLESNPLILLGLFHCEILP